MKRLVLLAAMVWMGSHAWAAKTCDDVKAEVSAKIESHGAKGFTLDVVDKAHESDKRVVGTCDGGRKKILYTRK